LVVAVVLTISQKAIDLIIREEVSSEAVYRKKYTRPEWPGVQSGVTIGIGYDVGYSTPARLRADWNGRIPAVTIDALSRACGVTGGSAQSLTQQLRSQVFVPWEAAISNFEDVVLPRWIKTVTDKLPNCDKLPADCLGALVSLAYNRGPSFGNAGDRYKEMRAIKALMASKDFAGIPAQFRSMKRLWPTVPGLQKRREREAQLFEQGLRSPSPKPRPQPDPAPRPDINPPPPDIEPTPPAPKPGWWSNIWSKIGAAIGTATGLGGITWLTDWQIAAMFFGFLLICGAVALAVFFWIWDAEDIRRWSSKQGGEE
jgi:hypothetical protein